MINVIEINWVAVLNFPEKETIKCVPVLDSLRNCLIEDITSSLVIIIIVGIAIINLGSNKRIHIKTIDTNNLSLNRSIKAPKSVVEPVFLAIYPSRKSVRDARANKIALYILNSSPK